MSVDVVTVVEPARHGTCAVLRVRCSTCRVEYLTRQSRSSLRLARACKSCSQKARHARERQARAQGRFA